MNKIKYRAWEKNLKEMIEVEEIDFIRGVINGSSIWRFFDEIELMQYTGLKDKNGKEIYEGDILRVYDDFFRDGLDDMYGVVKFDNGRFYLNTFKPYYNETWIYFEVVGNIYENKDLLEEE